MTKKIKVLKVLTLVAVVLIAYVVGFNNGEESIYRKAENDRQLLELYSKGANK